MPAADRSSRAARPVHLLLTCEHASNRVPAHYRALFTGHQRLLASHRGWDIGALAMAQALARCTGAPLFFGRVTRLLVDLNRSPEHPRLLSEFARTLPPAQQRALVARYHTAHWRVVQRHVRRHFAAGERVLHVAVHSFTPVLDGKRRRADIGLLFDPAHAWEARVVELWQPLLQRLLPRLTVLRNSPYRGTSDGLPTALRRHLPARGYAGLELEVNQRLAVHAPETWRAVVRALCSAMPELTR